MSTNGCGWVPPNPLTKWKSACGLSSGNWGQRWGDLVSRPEKQEPLGSRITLRLQGEASRWFSLYHAFPICFSSSLPSSVIFCITIVWFMVSLCSSEHILAQCNLPSTSNLVPSLEIPPPLIPPGYARSSRSYSRCFQYIQTISKH